MFDVNETLSDMAPLAYRFADVGAPPALARLWFAALLRDGFARTAAGKSERFAVLAESGLRVVLHGVALDRPVNDAVAHILDGFAALSCHPDCPPGVRAFGAPAAAGDDEQRGGRSGREAARRRGPARGVRAGASVEDAGMWKPAPGAYGYVARVCGVAAEDLLMVAVHPGTSTARRVRACARPGSTGPASRTRRSAARPTTACRAWTSWPTPWASARGGRAPRRGRGPG